MDKKTRALVDAARQAIKQLDGVYEGRGAVATLEAALKPFDRAAAPRLAWTRNGAEGYTCRIGDRVYAVFANGNEPERSAIRWVASCDNRWLSDGEPRCADAKLLCFRHAQRAAGVAV